MDSACPICGKKFGKPANASFDLCPSCLAATKNKYGAKDGGPDSVRKTASAVSWIILLVGAALIAWRAPEAAKAVALLHPSAPAATNPDDLCMAHLWAVSALIQQGKWPAGNMTCPSTKAPYVTKDADGDLTVSCPNPAAHGLKSLSVSRRRPTPEAVGEHTGS